MPPVAPSMMSDVPLPDEKAIRIMIVDDSAVARTVLKRMISSANGFEVVAEAREASEALAVLSSLEVDIVLLDVEMPGGSGLDALPEILRRGRGARVLIVSSLCEEGAEANVRALSLGAADTLPKPGAGYFAGRFSQVLAERLRSIGRVDRHKRRQNSSSYTGPPIALRPVPDGRLGCLALGASTGGLHALGEFLRALPSGIGAPILITQHLPALFMPIFARQMEAASGRLASVAEEGQTLESERLYIAPGDYHLGLRRLGSRIVVELERQPAHSGCLPSVDRMFCAVSDVYGPNATAVVFSGMGRDGLAGSHRLAERGGTILVQDAESSAVWGMPRSVAEAGLASAVLPPADLARRVAEYAKGRAWK